MPQFQTVEKTVEVPQVLYTDRIVGVPMSDVPVPHMMEKTIEVVKLIPQERAQNRTEEQTIDVPVEAQRRVPTIQLVKKTVEMPQVLIPDRVLGVPVVM